jgi:hypothetical protein
MGYAYQDATVPGNVAASWGRTHTLAGALGGHLPDGWREGTLLGALLENGGVWGTFRWASGTRYTACPVEIGNEGVLSGQSCARGFQGELNGQRLPITKQFDLKLARNFAVGGTRVSGYVDARNLFNFDNTSAVFAATGSRESPVLEARAWLGDSAGYALEASANGVSLGDGSIDLRFGGSGAAGCGNWVDEASRPSSPNCVYLVRAERRFGDADGVFNVAEQRRASSALYNALDGGHLRSGPGRFIRLGATVEF